MNYLFPKNTRFAIKKMFVVESVMVPAVPVNMTVLFVTEPVL